jgi:hypothetical protein
VKFVKGLFSLLGVCVIPYISKLKEGVDKNTALSQLEDANKISVGVDYVLIYCIGLCVCLLLMYSKEIKNAYLGLTKEKV